MIIDGQGRGTVDGLSPIGGVPSTSNSQQADQGVGPGPVVREVILLGGSVQTTRAVAGNVDD